MTATHGRPGSDAPEEFVPTWLRGLWRREWIRDADGAFDDAESVHWLQADRAMGDIRVGPHGSLFDGISSLEQCGRDLLTRLAHANACTGHTTVTDVVDHEDGSHSCIAEWHSYGCGINVQPVVTYPEPGLLTVSADGQRMTERAPSGAYEELWIRVGGTAEGPFARHQPTPGTEWVVAGDHAVVAVDRAIAVPHQRSLVDLAADPSVSDVQLRTWLTCELSLARRLGDDEWVIVQSTLPWHLGKVLRDPS